MNTDKETLQVLRTLDKAGRMPPTGVFDLLTKGRKDKSGDVTPGCDLSTSQALALTAFVYAQKEPRINARLDMIDDLEQSVIDGSGKTAWDQLLEWYAGLPEPKNIAWIIDDIIEAAEAKQR